MQDLEKEITTQHFSPLRSDDLDLILDKIKLISTSIHDVLLDDRFDQGRDVERMVSCMINGFHYVLGICEN